MQTIEITAENANRRLDKFLLSYLNEAPHSFIYKMLRKKRIKLNGARAGGGELLQTGDGITLYLSPETIENFRKVRTIAKAKPLPLSCIIYENEHLLVVNKPAGLPSHGGMSGKDANDHLLAQMLYYLQESGAYDPSAAFVPALCNRLDVNTSGLVICGKTLHALQDMNALFANQGIDKEYLAVVEGILGDAGKEQVLEGYYQKDTSTNKVKITPRNESRSKQPHPTAITAYKILAISKNKKHTLLSVNPITGRSHQIRAHLASIGNPLAGDKKYGASSTPHAPAQLLHCRRLSVPQSKLTWEADPPEGMLKCVQEWF